MLFKPQGSTLLLVAAALVCVVFSPYSSAQSPSGATVATAKSIPAELRRPPTQHELVVPFWTLEPGWDTQIEVRNNLAQGNLDVIPVLRKSDGSELQGPPMTISSDEIKKLDLETVAANWSGRTDAFGSLLLRFNSDAAGNVYAAALVQRLGHPISFHFDAYPVTPWFATGSQESVWWLPQPTSDGYLVISNFSGSPVHARGIFTQAGRRYTAVLHLASHQTQRISIREAVQAAGFQPTQGGVKVEFDAAAGYVYVAEVLFDETAEFSALMKVFERDPKAPVENFTLRAPLVGLSVPDPMLGYPAGTVLHPTLLVRNATNQPIPASMLVNWKSDTAMGKIAVQLPAIAPEETRLVDLSALQNQGLPADAHWANVEITYSGRPGDLVPIAASYDKSDRYGLQSPFSDSVSFLWKGGMWHVDSTHGTLITTGNAGQNNARVAITLRYGQNGVYEIPEKVLAPGGQVWLDVGELIHDQVPDKQGRVIPPTTMEGSYEIKDLDTRLVGYLYEGKVVTDRTFGHATYGCAECCNYGFVGYDGFYLSPDPMSGVIGGGGQYTSWATNVCTGEIDDAGAVGWQSSNTSVATVDLNGWASFVGAGTSTISAVARLQSVNNPSCRPQTFQAQGPVNVQPPNLNCTSSVTRGGTATCTVTPSGVTVSGWQFKDNNGNTVLRSTQTGSLTWSGTMVTSGTVSVNVTGMSTPLSKNITVTNRTNFAFTAVNPTPLQGNTITCYDGHMTSLQSPPNATSFEGASCPDQAFSFATIQISDSGPNNGYQYDTSVTNVSVNGSQPTKYEYIVVSDLLGSTSFYTHQCGTYSSTNLSGFVAGSQLKQNVLDHEQGIVFSHWTEYRDAQNSSSNNIGTVLEAIIAAPGTSQSAFSTTLTNAGTSAISRILTAVATEPCNGMVEKDSSQSCKFCGAVNYSPYTSCGTSQPVPHCQ